MAESVSIREELERNGRGFFQTVGTSMEPLLHHQYSTVVIEKPKGRLKKGDVALFLRLDGSVEAETHYILHRVVKVLENGYLICGDNCLYRETVLDEQIIGVMAGFFNGQDYTPCDDAAYQQYVRTVGLRYYVRWCRALPGRAVRKLFG